MAVDDDIDGCRSGKQQQGEEAASIHDNGYNQHGFGKRAGWRGTTQPNLSRESKLSGANGDGKKQFSQFS